MLEPLLHDIATSIQERISNDEKGHLLANRDKLSARDTGPSNG